MRVLLPLALALVLPACATTPATGDTRPATSVSQRLTTAVERASAAWTAIRATAMLWLPYLSPERQAQVTAWIARGDQAIATARVAVTVAEATAALAQTNAAADAVGATLVSK